MLSDDEKTYTLHKKYITNLQNYKKSHIFYYISNKIRKKTQKKYMNHHKKVANNKLVRRVRRTL